MPRSALTPLAALLLLAACGADPAADADPRCAAVCKIVEPSVPGAYDICSKDSAAACIKECQVRIQGLSTTCASCQLEKARLGGRDVSAGDSCTPTMCTINGNGTSCSYPPGNTAKEQECIRMVFPRKEVACTTTFRPVSECAALCP